jgi:hypothetical protein
MENETTPIQHREQEVAQYDQNIEVYKAIASTTPSEWPERLLKFKGIENRHTVIAEVEDLDDVELLANLWAHDDALAAVRSEMVERAKSKAILEALKLQA